MYIYVYTAFILLYQPIFNSLFQLHILLSSIYLSIYIYIYIYSYAHIFLYASLNQNYNLLKQKTLNSSACLSRFHMNTKLFKKTKITQNSKLNIPHSLKAIDFQIYDAGIFSNNHTLIHICFQLFCVFLSLPFPQFFLRFRCSYR